MGTTTAASPVPAADIAAIRAFNRFFTRRVGVLEPGLLDSPWSLTEVRIMYELRHHPRAEALDLRRALGMDAGQLSRMLTKLQHSGLLSRSPSPDDGRRQIVELTPAGTRAAVLMDDRTNVQITQLIEHLDADDRHRLVDAMATVRRLFAAPDDSGAAEAAGAPGTAEEDAAANGARTPAEPVLREPVPGDLGWIVERHGAIYSAEQGWDSSFDAWVARLVADYGRGQRCDTADQRLWIAEIDGERVGCVSCGREDERTARLRLFLVEPSARGRGVGSLLVEQCLEFARTTGYERMVLSTYSVLAAARHLYQAAGFRLASSEEEHVFGHDLTAQIWEREL